MDAVGRYIIKTVNWETEATKVRSTLYVLVMVQCANLSWAA